MIVKSTALAAKPALVCATAMLCLFTSGCAALRGASPAVNNLGPLVPREDGSASAKDAIYQAFQAAYGDSQRDPPNSEKALAMYDAGAALVAQNCDTYFASNGQQETYLLFGKDALTLGGTLGSAVLSASRATARTTTAVAIGVSTVTAATDLYRKQLTYGADFANSAKSMVRANLKTFTDGVDQKKGADDYTFSLAIQDIRDTQAICTPSVIIANMSKAIASKQFAALDVTTVSTTLPGTGAKPAAAPTSTTTTTTTTTPPAPAAAPAPGAATAPTAADKAKAKQLQAQSKALLSKLQPLVDKGLLADPSLSFRNLDEVAQGRAPTQPKAAPAPSAPTTSTTVVTTVTKPAPPAHISGKTRLKLEPTDN